jgi:pseudouridine kinase
MIEPLPKARSICAASSAASRRSAFTLLVHNVARVLARLGVPVRLIGAVGVDAVARAVTGRLSAEGIELSVVERSDFATGQYLALHDPDGALAAACVDDRVLSEAPAGLFDAIVTGLATSAGEDTIWFADANLTEAMLERVAARIGQGYLIANAVSEAKAPRLRPLLSRLDGLMLNRGEAAALTGHDPDTAAREIAEALAGTGLRSFVLTDGAGETHVLDSGALRCFAPRQAQVIDVTGAGDALVAGAIAALARGHGLVAAVPFGLAAASLTLSATGALAESLSWEAISEI